MTLVVAGKQPAPVLQSLVEKYLADSNSYEAAAEESVNPVSQWWGKVKPIHDTKKSLTWIEIEPVRDDRKLAVSWPIHIPNDQLRQDMLQV
jgi:secreted Zn-dependent insulinase-like peptidase